MTKLAPNDMLRAMRESRQLSRVQVAAHIGTSRANIGRWERGDALPDPVFMEKLCDLFQVPSHELGFPVMLRRTKPQQSEAIYDSAIPLTQAVSLVGREQDLARLKQLLRDDGAAVLTALNGLPGVGKTTLAIALAHDEDLREYFCDGVLWAGLGPEPNIAGQLRRWGRLLGLSTSEMEKLNSREDWAIALRSAIGARKMLLIIDDAWNVEDSLAFKVGGPNCAHLVTTRFPTTALNMRAANPIAIRELDEEQSMELLRLLAPKAVQHEAQKARKLVQAVGGLPLALTLMGNYLRMRAYSGQPRRIQAALDQLNSAEARLRISESRAPGDRHPSLAPGAALSLQAIIAVTDQQLNAEARAALYALSVFPAKPNSFSEEAALAIAACSTDTLDTLIDAGLLEGSGADRYMLHRTIADYARLHLADTPATQRLIEYANAYVEAHKTDYELLDQENAVILAALEAAFNTGKRDKLLRGVSAFVPFLLLRGNYTQAERHVKRAYEAALALNDRHSIIDALLYKGQIASKQGLYIQAEQSFKEGLSLAQQDGDADRTSALLRDLGWITWKQGNYDQADIYLQEGLSIARRSGHLERISALLNTLGSVAASQGNYPLSETYQLEGLEIARQSGDRAQICEMLLNLGVTAAEQGHDEQATAYMQEGLALARQIGHLEWTISLLLNMGEMSDDQGNRAQAGDYYAEALALARKAGQREWVSIVLTNMGKLAVKQDNYGKAGRYLLESLELAQQIGRPRIICVCLYEHGNLYLKQELLDAAEAAFSEMLTDIPTGDRELLAYAQYGLARVAVARGNVQEGRKLGEQSVKALEAIGHRGAREVKNWLSSIPIK